VWASPASLCLAIAAWVKAHLNNRWLWICGRALHRQDRVWWSQAAELTLPRRINDDIPDVIFR
jgi:hypothetical protein